MNEFLVCIKMVGLMLCGDFDPFCYDRFTECMLDEANTEMCSKEIGQITDIQCEWLLEE